MTPTIWYTHPALPVSLIAHDDDGWWLYHSPHSRVAYRSDKERLDRVNPALMPGWRAIVQARTVQ